MNVIGHERLPATGFELVSSCDFGFATAQYTARLDNDLTKGLLEAVVAPQSNEPTDLFVDGSTEETRMEAAITDALATEFSETRRDVINGWIFGSPDITSKSNSYDIEKFVAETPDEEAEVLASYTSQLPYDIDATAGFALYRLINRDNGITTQSFVHCVDDKELPRYKGQWRVESFVVDDEDDENEGVA